MTASVYANSGTRQPSATRFFVGATLMLGICLVGQLPAQVPAQLPSPSALMGCPIPQPQLSEKGPRPLTGPESVGSFVDSLSSNDATFEVPLGQGRILTLKEDLTQGKAQALIAVGDPTVIDFIVINPRQVRIVGQRLGVTDISVTTSTNKTYSFEVRVVVDLNPLRGQLRCTFPDARLKLGQLRDQIVVEGMARDTAQVTRIVEMIRAWSNSIQISQARRISGTQGRPTPGGDAPAVRPEGGPVPVPGPDPRGASPETGGPSSTQATVGPLSVLNLIRELRARLSMTVLFVTHDLAVARLMGERIVVMTNGAVVETGTVHDVITSPSHPYTRSLLAAVPEIGVPG